MSLSRREMVGLLIVGAAMLVAFVVIWLATPPAHAQEVATRAEVEMWIDDYAVKYSSPGYPYVALARDAWLVARCESGNFDERVLNNARRGRYGEVGVFQFLPGPGSIFWVTPTAEAGYDYWDPEANVAAAVWLLSQGYGRHWSCW